VNRPVFYNIAARTTASDKRGQAVAAVLTYARCAANAKNAATSNAARTAFAAAPVAPPARLPHSEVNARARAEALVQR